MPVTTKKRATKKKAVVDEPVVDGLTEKQRRFIAFYLGEARFNATKAARLAGYSGDDNQLGVQGHLNIRNSKIRAFIDAELDQRAMTANECLSELADIAKADWQNFVEIKYDGEDQPLKAQLRLTDKLKALELVGKHRALFTDKTELTGKDGGAIAVVDVEQAIINYIADAAKRGAECSREEAETRLRKIGYPIPER